MSHYRVILKNPTVRNMDVCSAHLFDKNYHLHVINDVANKGDRVNTHKSFEYIIPDDVLAVKSMRLNYTYYGGYMFMVHNSPFYQTTWIISSKNYNSWGIE